MTDKPKAWIFDVDGTLSLKGNRSPYEHHLSDEDEACPTAQALYHSLIKDYKIIICTGRDEEHRERTETWLFWQGFKGYEKLLMRPAKDERKDHYVKAEIFLNEIEPYYDIIGCVDDRNRVVDFWRGLGIVCLQIRPGDF